MSRKLRMGMIGGGRDSMIGPVHRAAAEAAGLIELVAGAFSSTRPKSRDSGKDLGLNPDRVYGVYRDMLRGESKIPEGERMDFISITTPSNMHYPVAMAAVDAGFHVICESPMTTNVDEAENLERKLQQTGKLLCLTEHHAGYPMVEEARSIVDAGTLGKIRRIVVEYPQGWLTERLEARGQKQAAWRTNPRNAGSSCCMSDVATHAQDLATRVTGLSPSEVTADLTTFVNGRMLDDDATVLLRYEDGARGMLWASQIALGESNGLSIRVYGDKGSLTWRRSTPDTLLLCDAEGKQEMRQSPTQEAADTIGLVELPAGHPPVSVAPLAEIYRRFAQALLKVIEGETPDATDLNFPNVQDGIRAARFNAAAIESTSSKDNWVTVP
jgi:predicted dehydrogenase